MQDPDCICTLHIQIANHLQVISTFTRKRLLARMHGNEINRLRILKQSQKKSLKSASRVSCWCTWTHGQAYHSKHATQLLTVLKNDPSRAEYQDTQIILQCGSPPAQNDTMQVNECEKKGISANVQVPLRIPVTQITQNTIRNRRDWSLEGHKWHTW